MLRAATWLIPWILLLALFATDAQAQVSGANPKVITWQSPATTSEIFVGVLGEVARPGVYHLDPQSLSLQSVIRRAGGMKEEASHTIRLVRQERVVQSIFFSPQSDGILLPGDLLIVESKRSQAAVSKMYESDPQVRSTYAADPPGRPTEDAGVRLAFLNVLDRPVIVKVRHEQANLLNLVQMLDQPAELAQAVKVLSPERMLSQATTQPVQTVVNDGSVLVFPRYSINRSKLPPLPLPIESGIATGALPSLIGGRSGQSPELRNVGQLPPLMARQQQESMPANSAPSNYQPTGIPAPSPAIPAINPPPLSHHTEAPTASPPAVSSSARIATIPFSGTPPVKSSSRTKSLGADSPLLDDRSSQRNRAGTETNGLIESTELQTHQPMQSHINRSNENPAEDEESDQSMTNAKASIITLRSLFAVLGCVVILMGTAIGARRILRHPESSQSPRRESSVAIRSDAKPLPASGAIPTQPAEEALSSPTTIYESDPLPEPIAAGQRSLASRSLTSRLDQLIRNELRVREEGIDFPSQIVLQGRIVSPPVFRVDHTAPSALSSGPHFKLGEQAAGNPVSNSSADSQANTATGELDGPHPIGPSKPNFLRRRAGEKTVAAAAVLAATEAAAEGTISNPPAGSETKLSSTPLTDALRQLQGGQS